MPTFGGSAVSLFCFKSQKVHISMAPFAEEYLSQTCCMGVAQQCELE